MSETQSNIDQYFGFSDRNDLAGAFQEGTGSRWDSNDPFVPAEDFPTDDQILLASYDSGGYEGHAYVLFRGTDGKLYEVECSHCSCNGLEDGWAPGEVTPESLALRIKAWDSNEYESTNYALDADAKAHYRTLVAALLSARC